MNQKEVNIFALYPLLPKVSKEILTLFNKPRLRRRSYRVRTHQPSYPRPSSYPEPSPVSTVRINPRQPRIPLGIPPQVMCRPTVTRTPTTTKYLSTIVCVLHS